MLFCAQRLPWSDPLLSDHLNLWPHHHHSTTIGKHLIGVSPSPIGRRLPGTPGAGGAGSRTPLSDAGRKLLAAKVARAVRPPALPRPFGAQCLLY